MLILTEAGTDSLEVTTGQDVPVDVHVSWVDVIVGTSNTPGRTNTLITTATTTSIVPTPAAGTQRVVKHVNIANRDATQSVDVTVIYDTNGTDVILYSATLAPSDVLEYQEGVGWKVVTKAQPQRQTISMWPVYPVTTQTSVMTAAHFATVATRTTVTAMVFPLAVAAPIHANRMMLPVHITMTSATTNSNWSFTLGHSFGLYTHAGNSLSLLSSFSHRQLFSYASAANSTQASATWSMNAGSGSAYSTSRTLSTSNAGNTSLWTSISSLKLHQLAYGSFSVSPGMYWGVWAFSSSTGGANLASISGIGVNTVVAQVLKEIGLPVASTEGILPLIGAVSMTQTDTGLQSVFDTVEVTTRSNNVSFVNRSAAIQMWSVV